MSWGFSPTLPAAEQQSGYAPLTADVGTFSLSGQSASLSMPAEAGIFTLTGQALGNPPLIAEPGSFSVTGFAPGIPPLEAEHGAFSLAGQDLGFPTYQFTAEHGQFRVAGRLFNQPVTPSSTIKIVTLGDSIFENANGNTSAIRIDNQADGEIHWVKARGKAGFRHEVYYQATARWIHNGTNWASAPLFNGANQGHAGDWAKGVERRLTAVLNMNPDVVVLNIGTNNGLDVGETSAAAVIATLGNIVPQFAGVQKRDGSGIMRLVIGTIRPRVVTAAASGTFSIEIRPADRVRLEEINAYIRTLDNDSTIFVWDSEPDLLDPNPSAPLLAGSCYRWAVRDGVHLAPRGAFESSRSLELTLDRILKDGTWFNSDPTVSNAVANGALTGTGGTAGTGTSGQVPTNFSLINFSGVSSIITTTSATSAGNWQIAVSSVGGSSSSSNTQSIRAYSDAISVAGQGWTSSTWVKLLVEVSVTSTQVLGAIHADLVNGAGNSSSTFLSQAIGPTLQNRATEDFAHEPWSGWLETTAQQVGSATNLAARIDIEPLINRAGSVVVTIKKVIVREVEDPRTLFPYDPMDPQVYGLTGQEALFDLDGSTASLVAETGVFVVAGQDVETDAARRLTCDAGKFAALGNGGVPLVDEQGNYLYDELGQILYIEVEPAEFNIFTSLLLTADVGAFALVGQDAGLIEQSAGTYAFAAEAGVFPVAGQDATLAAALITAMQLGEFAITGQDAGLLYNKAPLAADVGTFATFGQVVSLRRDLFPEHGTFVVSGSVEFSVARRRVYIQFGPLLRPPGKLYPIAVVPINGTFNDEAGLAFDPLTVSLFIISPSGTESTYTYGEDAEIRRTADGRYVFDVTLDEPGRWHYQWRVLASDVMSVKQGDLLVQDTPFYSGSRQRYA